MGPNSLTLVRIVCMQREVLKDFRYNVNCSFRQEAMVEENRPKDVCLYQRCSDLAEGGALVGFTILTYPV